jgi:hypothetical protein
MKLEPVKKKPLLSKVDVRNLRSIFSHMQLNPLVEKEDSIASFEPEWEPKIKKKGWSLFSKTSSATPELRERVHFLWAKLRVACRQKDLLRDLEIDREKHLDRNFGMRNAKLFVDSDEEIELEEKNKVETILTASKKKTLPWYILSEDTLFAKCQKTFV